MTDEPTPGFGAALRAWAKVGLLSFGGPSAQIALMHRVVVDENGWLSERRFLNALGFCMLLPGPEAMQLATYVGWRLHGVLGGLAAGLLFVLPGAAVVLALALVYGLYGHTPALGALVLGDKAAVLAIVLEALIRVARRALVRPDHWALAILAFLALFCLALPFPLVVLAAALWGFWRGGGEAEPAPAGLSLGGLARTVALWGAIWLGPILALRLALGEHVLVEIAAFFSKLAVFTFGGAYAVLAYMAQDAVEAHGWLTAGEMMDGLGLAETTPGPLILVTEFVGFLAAFRAGGPWLGVAGAAVTLWATFAPCFLWIFAGAPYIDWIASRPRLTGALAGITAAVVGVILNLSIWFALHVLFREVAERRWGPVRLWTPDVASLDWRAAILALVAAALLFGLKWGVARVLGVAAAGGLLLSAA
ncbi:MAG: chromate efflux transporter [Alphaproteobacteria bacterium]